MKAHVTLRAVWGIWGCFFVGQLIGCVVGLYKPEYLWNGAFAQLCFAAVLHGWAKG